VAGGFGGLGAWRRSYHAADGALRLQLFAVDSCRNDTGSREFTAVAGAYQHWKMGNVDWKSVKYIAPAGIIGVIIGSVLFYFIKDYHELIDLILGLIFAPIAVSMIYEGLFKRKKPDFAVHEIAGKQAA
jgi:hypothetical protein